MSKQGEEQRGRERESEADPMLSTEPEVIDSDLIILNLVSKSTPPHKFCLQLEVKSSQKISNVSSKQSWEFYY